MSGVRVSHLGPENRKNRQKWRFFCVLGSGILRLDPQCFFNVGQLNSNGARISSALIFVLTHILTHNTAIHNGQDRMFVYEIGIHFKIDVLQKRFRPKDIIAVAGFGTWSLGC